MKKFSFLALMMLLGTVTASYGQQKDSTRSEVQKDLENALESFDPNNPDLNTEELTQILQDLAANPVNINQATTDNLLLVPGLNLRLVKAIIRYRDNSKPFESVDELVDVPGIGKATLEKMRPYVTVGSGLALGKSLYTNYHYWASGGGLEVFSRYQQTLQPQAGYQRPDSAGGYLGSPIQYYQRFRYRSDHLSVNLTQQKDPGERTTGVAAFDYNSWHVALENNGKLKEFIVGDYSLSFGQGLVLLNGRTFGKGRDVIAPANRSPRGLQPYASSQETNAFHGVGATYGGKLQFTGFYSNRYRSASVIKGDTLRSPQMDGFHRTENELAQKNDLKQQLYGGRVRYEFPFGIIGATGYKTTFNKYISGGTRTSARYDFNGRSTSTIGLDYTLLAGPAIIFGEGGRSQNGGLGFVTGLESAVGLNTELTIAYRNYAKDFQSILGNGFGETSGTPQNEEGVYIGLKHTLNNYVTLSAYLDQYRFPAPRFGTSQPTQGYDWLGLVEVNITNDLQFYVQGRNEIKDDEYSITDKYGRDQTRLGEAQRSSLRGQLEYQVNSKIRLRTRGEVVRSRQAGKDVEYGYLMYQDLRITPTNKLKISTRATVFDTKSFDTRVYQFEDDLLYVLSNQVLYDQGERLYLVLDYEPLSYLEIWAKFGITIFENRQTISSGLNEIQGNRRSDIGLQIRIKV